MVCFIHRIKQTLWSKLNSDLKVSNLIISKIKNSDFFLTTLIDGSVENDYVLYEYQTLDLYYFIFS